ncbi:hypothetical protein [Mesorhizobium sp. B2-4-12]|nr:hypothetical protein [Mesorhizobium sp. B2-4-12]
MTYDKLAERLKEHGFNETKASIPTSLPAQPFPRISFSRPLRPLAVKVSN